MKKYLLIISLVIVTDINAQKISGAVTYLFNEYQGNKADVGAKIYVLDASTTGINFLTIDSVIEAEPWYAMALGYMLRQGRSKKNESLPMNIPDPNVQKYIEKYGVNTKEGFKNLDERATVQIFRFTDRQDVLKTKADGIGNYSINLKKPGTYYILITSANKKGIGANSSDGQNYLEKIVAKEGDEKNVSPNFKPLSM